MVWLATSSVHAFQFSVAILITTVVEEKIALLNNHRRKLTISSFGLIYIFNIKINVLSSRLPFQINYARIRSKSMYLYRELENYDGIIHK